MIHCSLCSTYAVKHIYRRHVLGCPVDRKTEAETYRMAAFSLGYFAADLFVFSKRWTSEKADLVHHVLGTYSIVQLIT